MGSLLAPVTIKVQQGSPGIHAIKSWRSPSARQVTESDAVPSTSAQPLRGAQRSISLRTPLLTNCEESVTSHQRAYGGSSNEAATKSLNESAKNGTAATKVVGPEMWERPQIHERWREIQGQNDWTGLLDLDPKDLVLRSELIRVGEFAQATYDAFDYDERTPFCGSCRFSKGRLLEKTQLADSGYEVTNYIYTAAGDGVPESVFDFLSSDNAGQLNLDETWSREQNWQGFVAVTTDLAEIKRLGRRDILVAWRGTITSMEWTHNLQDYLAPVALDQRWKGETGDEDVGIEAGFFNLYMAESKNSNITKLSARDQVLNAVRNLIKKYGHEDVDLSITITGHSLGAALATISAYDIAQSAINQPDHPECPPHEMPKFRKMDVIQDTNLQKTLKSIISKVFDRMFGRNPGNAQTGKDEQKQWTESGDVRTIPVTVFSFAGPRVGNDAFRDRMDELKVKVLRVVNKGDIVPRVPGIFVNEKTKWLDLLLKPLRDIIEGWHWTYIHVGQVIEIDSKTSHYLNDSTAVGDLHNLEAYLHVLSGYQGPNQAFDTVVPRDPALVNKASALLNSKYLIHENWYYQQYKGLVREKKNGMWITKAREDVDLPQPEVYEETKVEFEVRSPATARAVN